MVCCADIKFYRYVYLVDAVVRLLTVKLVAFAVQVFYAYRIKLLASSNFVAVVVVLVNILFFAAF